MFLKIKRRKEKQKTSRKECHRKLPIKSNTDKRSSFKYKNISIPIPICIYCLYVQIYKYSVSIYYFIIERASISNFDRLIFIYNKSYVCRNIFLCFLFVFFFCSIFLFLPLHTFFLSFTFLYFLFFPSLSFYLYVYYIYMCVRYICRII